jgi:hypothetical protein
MGNTVFTYQTTNRLLGLVEVQKNTGGDAAGRHHLRLGWRALQLGLVREIHCVHVSVLVVRKR